MPVPEGIRRVPRPKNTVVIDSGHDGPLRYAVRQRAGVKYGPQGQARPINGSVIGHICGGSFVLLGQITRTGADGPDVRSYGAAAFVHSEGADILQHLLSVYLPQDAYAILVIAMLRAIKPEIKKPKAFNRVQPHLHRTVLSGRSHLGEPRLEAAEPAGAGRREAGGLLSTPPGRR